MQLRMTQRGGQRLGPLLFISGSVDGHNLQKASAESRRNCRSLQPYRLLNPTFLGAPSAMKLLAKKALELADHKDALPRVDQPHENH
jgi:hypothetical protein